MKDLAFPLGSGDERDPCGLTKREYFAGIAMQGRLAKYADIELGRAREIARESVRMADALISELVKEQK